MTIHLTRNQIEILYAFKGLSNDFIVDDSGKLYAILDGHPMELGGVSDERIESPWD